MLNFVQQVEGLVVVATERTPKVGPLNDLEVSNLSSLVDVQQLNNQG